MEPNRTDGTMNPGVLVSLIVVAISFTLVQLLYAGIIRPNAEYAVATQGTMSVSSIWVILNGIEQQICISLMLVAIFLMGYKIWRLIDEEAIYSRDFLSDHDKAQPLDTKRALDQLESSRYRDNPALATWIMCIRRFQNTNNVQHAADAIASSVDNVASQLENGNNMIRYMIWAIPSIGFVGTVRGIGMALAQADEALAGDISGMTASLGLAFNSTLVALLISLLLMYLMHLLNSRQDTMVLNIQSSCEKSLLSHLHR
ncbi:MotA/TolQ/ExbB proton channel family protein [Aliidiomarina halalkaliphila]|uniref:MotA/TolQ/ExbB proton channel family protein n=1 Tax=Aliidiomarina halalkaliphila TaxID=2593535 RepID=A0A552X0V7_9GAMM|nr:MotA/TolQ/ExbB proton channel family protein [Aliidiomarina halalkaliphila]TRW48688.1 MotA/TolQ/ExbB proton channel family protein [Aliidiomarina halalkaliphila]